MLVALTREVSPSLDRCELTHLARQPIDVERARAQHDAYESCLAALGCEVRRLPAAPDLPDGVFVEDTAVVLEQLAIIARPGAPARRAETTTVEASLRGQRRLQTITAPGTLDGGDVLAIGKRVFVGRTRRTNDAGIDQLRAAVGPFGYQVLPVAVDGCLHLKTAVTPIDEGTLLVQRAWVDAAAFAGLELQDVAPEEPMAANALRVGEVVIFPAAYPRTHERLANRGLAVVALDASELAKAEGGLTCCSLIFPASAAGLAQLDTTTSQALVSPDSKSSAKRVPSMR